MPNQSTENQDTFFVGLCMAGAVSAGAYTAGVMDYLIESLNEWEKRRSEPGVPTHKVQIPVMGGASAGGMTSVMAAASLNNPLTPINEPSAELMAEHPENKLYHSWVDLCGGDVFATMLDTSDIKQGAILSALNSSFISGVAQRVLAEDPTLWQDLPPFIKPGLKFFTTLSNLQGFPYVIPFNDASSDAQKYNMTVHNDYACFQLVENDNDPTDDGWMPMNLKTGLNADIGQNAAMATGAFPVGLQSRILTRDAKYVNKNPWLKDYLEQKPLPDGPYQTLNVDGGLINNEPFEKVRDVLVDITNETPDQYNDFSAFKSTVLMIQPFPTTPPVPIKLSTDLPNVIGLTLSTMLSQMRAKPVNLADALKPQCAGQFLITPSRRVPNADGTETTLTGEMAMSCGVISGFGGFMNKEFRVHDYFLGRFNCKIFLRDYFTIPADKLDSNPIFKNGYASVNLDQFKSKADGSIQIIPQFGEDAFYAFPNFKFNSGSNWPVVQDGDVEKYRAAIKARVQAVLLNVSDYGWFTKSLLWVGAKVVINRAITDRVINTIKAQFEEWKLLAPDNNN